MDATTAANQKEVLKRQKAFASPSPMASTTSIEAVDGETGDSPITYHPGVAGNKMFQNDRMQLGETFTDITMRCWHRGDAEDKKNKERKAKEQTPTSS
ncbi:uncharacterized protein SPSK_00626 [Sporothrix schenckii 1099-18]|uniref:Uncharacterized protein n=1 Tax=Sporothrix schenckii 1099-18 TaxID=1397361 RepID=A0A0F2LTV5_SPOSC|nr:uncharacterized protein SPSK_00626 [Sporothrix schenckii 1099-18]KJR79930.1 hypothetical protein SPSK_00626 [Sporothrix schenckii 1099-18]